ncbi:secreted antigen 1 [Babesia caballi]|uniref:Secreted antigen 1 n=1 Tax=Babesia caballi TaxID=5871 RepID=A0AAV4LZK9_BABCB|nr:secreted antigen 1 [Babesia caballi]
MAGCRIKNPKTLKEALDLLGSLHKSSSSKQQVIQALQTKVETVMGQLKNGGGIATNFDTLCQMADELRTTISSENHYFSFDNSSTDCTDRLVKYVLKLLPNLYSTLYFLFFNINDTLWNTYGGGKWAYEDTNPVSSFEYWLMATSKTGKDSDKKFCRNSCVRFLPGGYDPYKFKVTDGYELYYSLSQLVNNDAGTGGALQYLLICLFPITPWYTSNTATAIAFFKHFFRNAASVPLNQEPEKETDLKAAWEKVSEAIKPFTPEGNHEGHDHLLVALYEGSDRYYDDVFNPINHETHIRLLQKNLGNVITSLKTMARDCVSWSKQAIDHGSMAGPFPYGFMFGGAWDEAMEHDWETTKKRLPEAISALASSLTDINNIVNKDSDQGSVKTSVIVLGSVAGVSVAAGVTSYARTAGVSLLSSNVIAKALASIHALF